MGIILMFAGFVFFALSLDWAFSDRFGKKSKNAAPVILLVSIVLFGAGVVVNNESGDYSFSGFTSVRPGGVKPDDSKPLKPLKPSGSPSQAGSGDGAGQDVDSDNKNTAEDKENNERPKGWANGLGGTFEKWKTLFGPPDDVELINNTGKATFLDRYINADFTDGKVTSFSLDLGSIKSSGYKLDEAKEEIDQFIPPDSEMVDDKESGQDKTYTEFYRSEIMKKDLLETDDGSPPEEGQIGSEKFNIIYHKLDNGNIDKVHVKTDLEDKAKE